MCTYYHGLVNTRKWVYALFATQVVIHFLICTHVPLLINLKALRLNYCVYTTFLWVVVDFQMTF